MPSGNTLARLSGSILPWLLTACSSMAQPDLTRLYQQSQEVEQPPVILIHGIMGSRLTWRREDDGKVVVSRSDNGADLFAWYSFNTDTTLQDLDHAPAD